MSAAAARRQSIVGMRRTSMDPANTRTLTTVTSAQTQREPVKQWENTYQLEPEVVLSSGQLRKILVDVLSTKLNQQKYNRDSAAPLAKELADLVKKRCKDLSIPRYKYVCMVSLGPSHQCTVSVASRCVWNPSVDTYAEHTYKNSDIYATAVVYGIYLE